MAQTYLNKKQELFCQFVAGGETYAKAYELAGYEPSTANASTLANKEIVQKRIGELKQEATARENEFKLLAQRADNADPQLAKQIETGAIWTFQRVMDMMAENVRLAQIAGEYRAANECLKMMGDGMKMFDKATSPEDRQLPAGHPVAYIGQVTNILEGVRDRAAEAEEVDDDNSLAPRRGRK